MRGAGAGAGKAAGAGAPSDGSDFQMTEEEVSRFQKAFKDPSFRDMFREFAEELADPANRELRAKELAALEREQAILEGRSVDSVDTILVQPSASFCVKVRDATSHKVFINVCVSDKIEPAHEEDKQQKQQQRQQRDTPSAPRAWQIPFCLAAPRRERDHANESCMTYDFVVAPNAIELAKRSPAFHKMLVETAVETVASRFTESIKTADAVVLGKPYHGASGKPRATAVRRPKTAAEADAGPSPMGTQAASLVEKATRRFVEAGVEAGASASASKQSAAASSASSAGSSAVSATRAPATGSVAPTSTSPSAPARAPAAKPATAVDASASGPVAPHYTVVHSNNFDLRDYTNDQVAGAAKAKRAGRLVVRIDLPKCASMAGVDLDATPNFLYLEARPHYSLKVALPVAVDGDRASAKFSRDTRQLVVELPCVAVAAPAGTGSAASASDTRVSSESDSDSGAPSVSEDVPKSSASDRAVSAEAAVQAGAPGPAVPAVAAPVELVWTLHRWNGADMAEPIPLMLDLSRAPAPRDEDDDDDDDDEGEGSSNSNDNGEDDHAVAGHEHAHVEDEHATARTEEPASAAPSEVHEVEPAYAVRQNAQNVTVAFRVRNVVPRSEDVHLHVDATTQRPCIDAAFADASGVRYRKRVVLGGTVDAATLHAEVRDGSLVVLVAKSGSGGVWPHAELVGDALAAQQATVARAAADGASASDAREPGPSVVPAAAAPAAAPSAPAQAPAQAPAPVPAQATATQPVAQQQQQQPPAVHASARDEPSSAVDVADAAVPAAAPPAGRQPPTLPAASGVGMVGMALGNRVQFELE